MLQKADIEDGFEALQDHRNYLTQPAFYWDLFKRRWFYFVIPFVLVGAAGIVAATFWPPTYLSEGKILVQSQQIPSELVRPTVTNAAEERIQVIQQRTMTRDNLIAIADKFQLFPEKRALMSPTELVEQMKKSAKIAPVDIELDFKQRVRQENPIIVFSVGFEYGDPAVATRVANELMTRILGEDLRDRTSRAIDTTKFLEREVQRLQSDNTAIDAKIAQLKLALAQEKLEASAATAQPASTLAQLKAELVQKGALYSDKHPVIQSLSRQVDAMEKATTESAGGGEVKNSASLDELVAQRESLQKNLDTASAKLLAARLGENLEKDQQSEKLEVIEQPTVPQEPIKPKRAKLAALALAAAFMAGAGLTFLVEISDSGIRRSSDLLAVVDHRLLVSIPYIVTAADMRRKRRGIIALVLVSLAIIIGALVAAYLFLPPLDLMFAKARAGLFK